MFQRSKDWPPYYLGYGVVSREHGWVLPTQLPPDYSSVDTTCMAWFFYKCRREVRWYWKEHRLPPERRIEGIRLARVNLAHARTALLQRNPRTVRRALKRFGLSMADLEWSGQSH